MTITATGTPSPYPGMARAHLPVLYVRPVHLGVEEYGGPVYVNLAERNMLICGEDVREAAATCAAASLGPADL